MPGFRITPPVVGRGVDELPVLAGTFCWVWLTAIYPHLK